jgi:hypothetical protein
MSSSFFRQQQKERIENHNTISYKEICEILDAFQIASGQGFAIGKTKALLDYLKKGKNFIIENFEHSNNQRIVSTLSELANIFKDIDQFVDLPNDKDFKEYFS